MPLFNMVIADKLFHFNRVYTVDSIKYHVSVKDDYFPQNFVMEKRGGVWQIVQAPMPPDWILALENELGKAIEVH